MKLVLLFTIYLLTFSGSTVAQGAFAQEITIGNSLTYLRESRDDRNFTHGELTYAKNVSVSLNDKLDIGINWLSIWSSNIRLEEKKDLYNLIGIFVKYNLIKRDKSRFGIELGYHIGDYCTCGNNVPFKMSNLSYLGWGIYLERNIFKNVYLDLAFNPYLILNDIKLKYGYTQYVIGVNYKITR